MTQAEFWKLYDNGELENVSHWYRKDAEDFTSEIIAFAYDGKYYLRIVQFNGYYTWHVGHGSSRHVVRDGVRTWSVIKEFDNKNSANAYFKKCAAGYTKG